MPTEHQVQAALFKWAALMIRVFPELELMYAVPNAGRRSIGAARYMIAEGMKAGVPDVCLPIARGQFSALYIEHKVGKNKLTEHQDRWVELLRRYGNACVVSRSFEQSRGLVIDYLAGRLPSNN
jgi:hypothetical protein